MTVVFDPASWKSAGEQLQGAADAMYNGAFSVITSRTYSPGSNSPIESAISAGESGIYDPWHSIIGRATEGMTSVSSKMMATGADYEATEEANKAAARRFW